MSEPKLLAKTYEPKEVEDRIYSEWMEKGYFRAEIDKNKKPFTIVIPPPNVTGQLHMGHALDDTMQDILIRMKRMQGYSTLWLPGTDHAGISTEAKVVEKLKKEGLRKEDLGREKFLEEAWAWKKQYGGRITEQLKKLGCSCDWSRERFTYDEGFSKAVLKVFVDYYKKGLIYKGERIINWCPACKTSISDAEVDYEEKAGNLWHIKYPTPDGKDGIIVATTRPETMLGDTAVAVHPDDERYAHLIGKTVVLPLMNREIPIVADEYVDKEFGTGAVKITPAHDPNDFEVGLRHNLPQIKVMDDIALMNENAGQYKGLDRYEARKKIVEDLRSLGLLVKIDEHAHNVGGCYRCHTIIEPIISEQWFVKMQPLAGPAVDIVKQGIMKFVPEKFAKIYFSWLENIHDWCISRQLWWGHRIPAYYCQDCGHIMVETEAPKACEKCGSSKLKQDEDTLDTWFSSALWPYATMGWPEKTEDLEYFYPTNVLVTGYDIIFFWVVRMAFSAMEHMKKEPFEYVLIHGIVRDAQGRKMSKSLGNGIDPLEIIEQYGTDALRMSLLMGNTPGNDIRFSTDRIESVRNFANKIWNASRFVLMNMDLGDKINNYNPKNFTLADKWILSRVNNLVKEVTENMESFELGIAAQKLYEFFWDEFCDWYIEMVKPRLYNAENATRLEAQYVLNKVLVISLKLLHPYMPFITNELYDNLIHDGRNIMVSEWPQYDSALDFAGDEQNMSKVMEIIKAVRNIRAEMNVPSSKKCRVMLFTVDTKTASVLEVEKEYFERLASAEIIINPEREEIEENTVSAVVPGVEIFIPLGELVDIEKEIQRLEKERENLQKEIARVDGMLSNERFMAKAPQKVVDEEKEKRIKYLEMLAKVKERIKAMIK
ncbi:MAG: valine--tRNA ligase [Deltaproteobacteria bacterium]